ARQYHGRGDERDRAWRDWSDGDMTRVNHRVNHRVIRAAIARAQAPFVIETCELDEPGAREVCVALEACGLCHTDLHAKDHGYGTPLPAVLGHEGVGRIEALGPGVGGLAIGDRVVISFGAC